MMKMEFSELFTLDLGNVLEGPDYERYKKSLLALILTQRLKVFDEEGGASGKWQPLSSKHQAVRLAKVPKNRRKRKNAVKILQDTGVLRQSFTSASGPGNAYRVEETTGDSVRLATNVEYAAIHNFGGTITTKSGRAINIPARPFDEFSEQDLDEINELTELFVNGEL